MKLNKSHRSWHEEVIPLSNQVIPVSQFGNSTASSSFQSNQDESLSRAHGGVVHGLHECAKLIEKRSAQLCVLAEDCNQPDYVKLVKALCADHNINLLTVPSAKTLANTH
ncbi:hypothetical protein YC2023_018215 [Brassica napus]